MSRKSHHHGQGPKNGQEFQEPKKDEQGNLINPHNPEYISKRPWYLGGEGNDQSMSLKHQSIQKTDHLLDITEADALYKRGKKVARASKWRKGSCKNCGAMTHKTDECVERPRARGAWKTNKDIEQDEVFVDVRSEQYGKLTYDAKRDKWLGYNPTEHDRTVKRYEQIDKARQEVKMQKLKEKAESDSGSSSSSSSSSDEDDSDGDEYKDKEGKMISKRVARQGGVGGAELKTTVRNLRIREDTAKYLRNLNPESAYYDPKTRSMRDNPTPDLPPEDVVYAGDNFIRNTGDATQLAKTQMFAWEAGQRGTEIHPQATPSQAEFMRRQFEEKKKKLEQSKKKLLLDKYGAQDHLKAPSRDLLLAQSEHYVEYSRDGKIVKGQEKGVPKSKYIEDVLENNHVAIWGSYYDLHDDSWGYGCCHSKVRNSYCTGQSGKEALKESLSNMTERAMLKPACGKEPVKPASTAQTELYGEQTNPAKLDKKKLKKAMKKRNLDANEITTAEDMEAYHIKKIRPDDPMAQHM